MSTTKNNIIEFLRLQFFFLKKKHTVIEKTKKKMELRLYTLLTVIAICATWVNPTTWMIIESVEYQGDIMWCIPVPFDCHRDTPCIEWKSRVQFRNTNTGCTIFTKTPHKDTMSVLYNTRTHECRDDIACFHAQEHLLFFIIVLCFINICVVVFDWNRWFVANVLNRK